MKCFIISLLLGLFVVSGNPGQSCLQGNLSEKAIYWGSTPADSVVKLWLEIPLNAISDFIRWELSLDGTDKSFRLQLLYGEAQPNTPGFWGGGTKKEIKGVYNQSDEMVYQLISESLGSDIMIKRVSDNIIHLLDPEKKLMKGNGGFSYTLNRKDPQSGTAIYIESDPSDSVTKEVYQGRTPCKEIAGESGLTLSEPCYKLKWLLTLYRDPVTGIPTTYQLKRTQHRQAVIEGKWNSTRENKDNHSIVIYQLDPDKPANSILLLKAGTHVLFFLDKQRNLMLGNGDFSYTLNRR